MNTRSILILTAILVFGVSVTMVLLSQSTSDTKAAEGATGLAAKRTKRARDTQSKPPTVDVKKRDSQPAAGEKFDPSEIRQALSELQALYEGGGSNQQIQDKIAALQAAIKSGMKKDPKDALGWVLGERKANGVSFDSPSSVLFVRSDPDFAIALLDQVPEKDLDFFVTKIGSAWAKSDPKAALVWANQQTDPEFKEWALTGVIPIMAKTDLQGAFAYAQSLPPGDSQDYLIRLAFTQSAAGDVAYNAGNNTYIIGEGSLGVQGAIAMIQSLPAGRTKDLAASGMIKGMALIDPQAAMDVALGIGDSILRTEAQEDVVRKWSDVNKAAAIQWIESLPEGPSKEATANCIAKNSYISDYNNRQESMDMALGIGDSNLRTQALKNVAREWFGNAPAAATQWIKSSALPQEVKTQLLLQR